MKYLVSFLVFIGVILSCERTEIDGVDLLGEWLVLRACDSCLIYDFKNDNELSIKEIGKSGDIYPCKYRLYRDNTIQIELDGTKDRYDIATHSTDTIEIMGFSLSSLPMEMNTLLKRLYE